MHTESRLKLNTKSWQKNPSIRLSGVRFCKQRKIKGIDEARYALKLLHATRWQELYEQGITKPKDRIESMIMASGNPYPTSCGIYAYAELYRLHKALSNMAAFCEDVIGSTTDPMMVSMVHEGRDE